MRITSLVIGASFAAVCILPPHFASAETAVAVASCNTQTFPANAVKPLIQNVGGNQCVAALPGGTALTAVAGTQTGIDTTAATALAVPTGATIAVVSVEGTNNASAQCARWRDDGMNPTASAGHPLASGAYLTYKVTALPLVLITAAGATCKFNASYYK